MSDFWETMGSVGAESAAVGGVEIRRGSRVRLLPRTGGDVLDLALAGRAAVVEAIDEDGDGRLHVSVTVEDDPGRDLGEARFLGHRFFFALDEIEPLEDGDKGPRILVAGIGNIFLGDDAFGVEVARRLAERAALAPSVDVRDFGIRGMDLAYALQDYEAVVFVDAAPRGEAPGTLSVIEPELDPDEVSLETHAMDPVRVLGLARALGRVPARVLVVACEPERVVQGEHDDELVGELSATVRQAADRALGLVEELVGELAAEIESTRKAVER